MIILQLLDTVPEWALKLGLNEESFDLLEQCCVNPENKQSILDSQEYDERIKLIVALEYVKDKGLNL